MPGGGTFGEEPTNGTYVLGEPVGKSMTPGRPSPPRFQPASVTAVDTSLSTIDRLAIVFKSRRDDANSHAPATLPRYQIIATCRQLSPRSRYCVRCVASPHLDVLLRRYGPPGGGGEDVRVSRAKASKPEVRADIDYCSTSSCPITGQISRRSSLRAGTRARASPAIARILRSRQPHDITQTSTFCFDDHDDSCAKYGASIGNGWG